MLRIVIDCDLNTNACNVTMPTMRDAAGREFIPKGALYGILELARDSIRDAKIAEPGIVIAQGMPPVANGVKR